MKSNIKKYLRIMMLRNNIIFKVINMFIPKYKKFAVTELYSYCLNNGEIVEMIDDSMHEVGCRLFSSSKEFYLCSKIEYEDRTINRKYISKITNIIVLAETDGFITGNKFLTDKMLWNKKGFDDFLTDNIRASNEEFCVIKSNWNNTVTIPKGICLAKMGAYNYFHFTFEVLARLKDIESLEQYKSWPLLVDAVVQEDSKAVELLNIMNINNRIVIWLERNITYEIGEVIVPAYYAWVPYLEPELPYIVDRKSIRYIQRIVKNKTDIYETAKKIYVARGNNKRLVNESDLIEVLKENEYEIFNPDNGTLMDEIVHFANADVIVGCYGAAFTNIIYCKPTVQLMIICPFELQIASGLSLATAVGIEKIEIIPARMVSTGKIVHLSSFEIMAEGIDKILRFSK